MGGFEDFQIRTVQSEVEATGRLICDNGEEATTKVGVLVCKVNLTY